MHGFSTILSLIFKLLGKIFRVFGINAILTIFFVIELIACIGYASEMTDYDKNSSEYELTGIESVQELDKDDPIFKEYDILMSDYDHYYLVRINIHNRYSERLTIPAMSAETEEGNIVVARRIAYYGDNMPGGYGVSACVPEGTETVMSCMLEISDYRLEETNVVKIYDYRDKKEALTVELPR